MTSLLEDFPAASRSAVVALAAAAADGAHRCTPAPSGVAAGAFGPAVAAGFLTECDGGYLFVDGDAFAQCLAEVMLPDARIAYGDSVALVTLLHKAWECDLRGGSQRSTASAGPGARLLAGLAAAGHDMLADIPKLFTASPPGGPPQERWYHALHVAVSEALVSLAPTAEQARAIGIVAARAQGGGTLVGHNFVGLAELARARPETGDALLDLLLPPRDIDHAALLPHVLRGVGQRDLLAALNHALDLTRDPTTAQAGVLALGGLPYDRGTGLLTSAFDRLDELGVPENAELAPFIAQAVRGTPGKADPDRAVATLERLASLGGVADAVALSLLVTPSRSRPPARTALIALATAPDLSESGLDNLRGLLSPLASVDPELVLDVAEAWVTSRHYATPGVPLIDDAFEHACHALPDDALARRMPAWLLADDPRLQRAAADIINDVRQDGRPSGYDPATLRSLEATDLHYLARQTLGRVHDGHALARLLLSLFDAGPLPTDLAEFVIGRLDDFVAYTRPHETDEVLKAVPPERTAAFQAAREVIRRRDVKRERRAALKPRKELQSPRIRTRAFVAAETRLRQSQLEAARSASFSIADLFTSIQIRAGSGFTFRGYDGAYSTSGFNEISSGVMSMWGDLVDPVGMQLQRHHWILQPRGGGADEADEEIPSPSQP